MQGWIGVDLDGTLSRWPEEEEPNNGFIGRPVVPMILLVKKWVAEGRRVKILTARANYSYQIPFIKAWLKKHGLGFLEITAAKDFDMEVLYDDRAIQVERNTGRLIGAPIDESQWDRDRKKK